MPLIECKAGPTETPVAGTMYHFERDKYGRFVSEVYNPKHIECFLSVVHFQQVEADPAPEETEAEVVQIEPPVAAVIVPPAEPVNVPPAAVITPPSPPAPPAAPVPRMRMAPYAPSAPIPPVPAGGALPAPVVAPVVASPALPTGTFGLGQAAIGQALPAGDAALTPPADLAPPPADPVVVRAQLAEKAATRRSTRRRKGK
ncbi:hypothetical protein LJR231_001572 [Phyllobacterium sp. LjRoot231]|uniref:hypothetical protein n=1 Tax=Phyllobacterium sp. LjRoot231 TaxID=3342289 RepID=UPI003ECCA364